MGVGAVVELLPHPALPRAWLLLLLLLWLVLVLLLLLLH
jgi:hypothetical protein